MMGAREEAAAGAIAVVASGEWHTPPEQDDIAYAVAALAAADAVMFSSEALERVARAIHDSVWGGDADGLDCDDFGPDLPTATRAVIAALNERNEQ